MKTEKHNPHYKLVSKVIGNTEFVYGETNEGENKGLEVYFYNNTNEGHYYSRRYLDGNVPKKYLSVYLDLREYVINNNVEGGFKLSL